MRNPIVLLVFLSLGLHLRAQQKVTTYTITADSVLLTSCDSSELIIQNHTQNVPGFLFNTGNGRTIFKRALQPLGSSSWLIGADTLNLGANAWLQGGNSFSTTGVLGTLDNNNLDLYTNGAGRARITNNGKIGIATTAPAQTLDVYGNVNLNDSVGRPTFAAYMLDELPVLSFGNEVGLYYNIAVGDSAGFNSSGGYRQVYVGYQAGMNDDNTGQNTFVGSNAGTDNSGGANVIIGTFAGFDNEGGSNVFVGNVSGAYSSGQTNVYVGTSAGYSPTGSANAYLGYYAGGFTNGDHNVEVGNLTGQYSQGGNNVFIGSGTGVTNAGNDNVFVGTNAGLTDTLPDSFLSIEQVTLLGDSSDVTMSGISNATAIGHKAKVHASNTMVFGDSATANWLFNSGATASAGAALVVGSNSTNGNGAYLSTGGTWTNASDKNKKENFEPIYGSEMLQKISELPITRWNYKGQKEQHIGPVAQDFYRIFAVGTDDKSISTIDPSGVALAGIQELYERYKTAERKTEQQNVEIEKQNKKIQSLEAEIETLKEMLLEDRKNKNTTK